MSDFAQTRTGAFPIGIRRGWGEWQRELSGFLAWVCENRFAHVDLGNDADQILPVVRASGVAVGSVDLPAWKELLSHDETKRREAVSRARAYIESCSRHGVTRFFAIMLPEDPLRPRAENFDRMLESYAEVSTALAASGAALAIEGWPGPGALCCTPETLRALFRELPSPAIGINYDPSHLLRMHIDPLRFLDEFAGHVKHVHAKDAEIDGDRAYTFGTEQEAAFEPPRRFGGPFWRYTLPGRGAVPWTSALECLKAAGFQGRISIELEDEHFNGTDSGEQRGFLESRDFLARS